MALSVLVTVGKASEWLPDLISRARALRVGNGFDPKADLGPVISPAAREKIEGLIGSCEEEGGKILLDGRGIKVDGYEDGNWVGPTVLQAKEGMKCHEIEIFGPVLTVLNVETLDEAIALVNRNKCECLDVSLKTPPSRQSLLDTELFLRAAPSPPLPRPPKHRRQWCFHLHQLGSSCPLL